VDVVAVDGQVGREPGGNPDGEAAKLGHGVLGLLVLLTPGLHMLENRPADLDRSVETGDLGGDMALDAPVGVGFALGPEGAFFSGGSPLPPARAVLGVV
jgi:hypothetical protein